MPAIPQTDFLTIERRGNCFDLNLNQKRPPYKQGAQPLFYKKLRDRANIGDFKTTHKKVSKLNTYLLHSIRHLPTILRVRKPSERKRTRVDIYFVKDGQLAML